jgi:hypothetical protein
MTRLLYAVALVLACSSVAYGQKWEYARLFLAYTYPVNPKLSLTQPVRFTANWQSSRQTKVYTQNDLSRPNPAGFQAFVEELVGKRVDVTGPGIKLFNVLGELGWELTDCVPYEAVVTQGYELTSECFFKRPITKGFNAR